MKWEKLKSLGKEKVEEWWEPVVECEYDSLFDDKSWNHFGWLEDASADITRESMNVKPSKFLHICERSYSKLGNVLTLQWEYPPPTEQIFGNWKVNYYKFTRKFLDFKQVVVKLT